MDDSTFKATLTELVGKTDEWLQYNYLPGTSAPVAWEKMDREGQAEYIRSCFRKGNTNANDPRRTQLDRVIENLSRLYLEATPAQRPLVRQALPRTAAFALNHFAWRMAVRALRERSQGALRLGLGAVCIEDTKSDVRETLTSLALLYHAAERTQMDPEQVFHEACTASTSRTRGVILAFLRRSPELKSISAFLFREGSGRNGATLERG